MSAARGSAGDRVGLGWRPELAAAILSHLDRIDVVEVIADDYLHVGRRRQRALETLAAEVPVVLHGVSLGLASTVAVETARLDAIARLVDVVRPAFWSEHLAFVRGGGVEIGHLAAPPRTAETVEGAAANVRRARAIVGVAPALENVATLIDPPGSELAEADWIARTIAASQTGLLLDLHNLHANAVNFGFDAIAALDALPLDRIAAVHLAGGRVIPAPDGRPRILDDHRHAVPQPVFDLLEALAARTDRPLTVILERDGRYPAIDALLAELDAARAALARGRKVVIAGGPAMAPHTPQRADAARQSRAAPRLEALLARLYVDADARALAVGDPRRLAREAGLDARETAALVAIDRVGLTLAAESFGRKRAHAGPVPRPARWRRLLGRVRAASRRARIPAKSGPAVPAVTQGGRHGREE